MTGADDKPRGPAMFDHLMIGLNRKQKKPGPYSHAVRVRMPETGLGVKLTEMLAFAVERNEPMPQGTAPEGRNRYAFAVFAFSDRATAAEFASRFDGELMPDEGAKR